GADDPPKPECSIEVVGITVRVIRLGGFMECRPQPIRVVIGKCTKQLIKGFHIDPRTKNSSAFFFHFLRMIIETVATKEDLYGRKPCWYGRKTTGTVPRSCRRYTTHADGMQVKIETLLPARLNAINPADMPAAG